MTSPSDTGPWTSLGRLADLPPGDLTPVAAGGRKLVVARPDAGAPAVLDNRCPHEGYPLSQGRLDGGLLTCCWHNWKFEVAGGRCVLGGEDVPCWPSRVVDGELQADLRGPDPAVAIPPLRESLAAGVLDHDTGRAVRDGLRLLAHGVSPRALLLELAALDARHGQWGSSHVLPLAADAARLIAARAAPDASPDAAPTPGMGLDGPEAMLAIAPVIELCGESNVRLPPRARAPAGRFGGLDALRAAVEAEDHAAAQAQLGGALADGLPWPALCDLLLALETDHFTDFGHPLIYIVKAMELTRADDDPGRLADLAFGLLDDLLYATREDTLPYWGRYQRRLEAWAPKLDGWWARQAGATHVPAWNGAALRDAVLDGSADQACDQLEQACERGVPTVEIARWLVAAGAHRLLRFHVPLDADPGVAENWLWATHRFTFAAAVRHAVTRLQAPEALRLLHQTLAFTHSGRPMDAPVALRTPIAPAATRGSAAGATRGGTPSATPGALPAATTATTGAADCADLDDVLSAIAARQTDAAVAGAAALLRDDAQDHALSRALEDLCLSDPLVRPIVVAHAIKTTWAALEERRALADHPDRDVPLLAAVRFLASPVVERRVAATVRTSIDWVVHGKVPRKLTQ